MLVLGIDAHKRTHTVVAIDSTGRKLGEKITTATTTADHLDMLRWAEQFGPERRWAVEEVIARLGEFDGLVARLALEHAHAVRDLIRRVNDLEREIKELVTTLAPTLLALPGCGVLSAAKIVGETADVTRFKSKDAFARHNGTAPLPVWSGNRERFRLSRAGNRQLNCAIHRIAVIQGRCHPPAKEFLERRMKLGNTRMEAIRAFKRRLSDVVDRDLLADAEHTNRQQLQPAA